MGLLYFYKQKVFLSALKQFHHLRTEAELAVARRDERLMILLRTNEHQVTFEKHYETPIYIVYSFMSYLLNTIYTFFSFYFFDSERCWNRTSELQNSDLGELDIFRKELLVDVLLSTWLLYNILILRFRKAWTCLKWDLRLQVTKWFRLYCVKHLGLFKIVGLCVFLDYFPIGSPSYHHLACIFQAF